MKKYLNFLLAFLVTGALLTSCEEDRTTFTGKQVGFEKASGRIMIPKDVTTTEDGTFKVMLISAPLSSDVSITFEIDAASTAVEGTHFTMSTKTVTIPAGQNFAEFNVTALNDGFSFGGEFVNLILNISNTSVEIAGEFAQFNLTISKEAFIDAFSGSFVAYEFYPPDPEPAYGPYTISCTVIAGTNSINLLGIYDWATQAVKVDFNPDPDNKIVTVAKQDFNPEEGLSLEGTGVYDDEAQTFEIDAIIYDGASIYDEVTFRYSRPGKSTVISQGAGRTKK